MITADFAYIIGRRGFQGAGAPPGDWYASLCLNTSLDVRSEFTDLELVPDTTKLLAAWTYHTSGILPPWMETTIAGTPAYWHNESGGPWGPIHYIVITGYADTLCMWYEIDPAITVQDGEKVFIPNGLRFTLQSPDD